MHAPVLCDQMDAASRAGDMDKQFSPRAVPRYRFPAGWSWDAFGMVASVVVGWVKKEPRSAVVEEYEPEFRTGGCRAGVVVYVNFDLKEGQLVRLKVRLRAQDVERDGNE